MADELNESMEAGAIAQNVPENAPKRVTEIVYGDTTKTVRERLLSRRLQNSQLIREGKEIAPEIEPAKVRYKLQDFNNGDGPSDYEKWRREKVDKGRKRRLEQENADAERSAKVNTSSYEVAMSHKNKVDGQIDDFLAKYIQDFGDLE